ncbi:unnamed protein product [Oikopleura dioica]|uniref:Uncharacterized protein n=1 Tax=Oikopleura dioica TaxID=34765 RepID=E4X3F3_OIKDI|nr:unnamed protein product [Oikopleura dioica]
MPVTLRNHQRNNRLGQSLSSIQEDRSPQNDFRHLRSRGRSSSTQTGVRFRCLAVQQIQFRIMPK